MWTRAWRTILFFGLLGGVVAGWVAPKMIGWYFTPPVNIGINCTAPIDWALSHFQMAEMAGIIIGAIVGLVIFILFRKSRRPELTGLPQDPTL
jgi:hypothetical protein